MVWVSVKSEAGLVFFSGGHQLTSYVTGSAINVFGFHLILSCYCADQRRLSNEQFKAFSALHDKMLRDLITDLSAMLRKIVDVKLYSIEQMTYGEFILSIPQITSLNTLSIKPLEGRIVMECNPAISHKIIAHLLGNGESSLTDSTEKELTEIELQVFNHFYQLIMKNLKKAWDDVSSINLKTESMDTNANANGML